MATAASSSSSEPSLETPQWLKTLPLAPEFHPTIAEFQDPISYILKIEKQASNYGICKIVPPLPPQPKKTLLSNLNRSLSARNPNSQPTFTTRHQQIGFCPRRPRPVQRPVWQSGENYTIQEFEAKAKQFEKIHLKRSGKKGVSALEIETLFWKASADKPFTVEYANDMPGSGFAPVNPKKWRETGEGVTVGETAWNMRGVSRSNGSLLRFMKDEIPGVTSPMVYIAMLFSWFAWHVEDHDLHSLNYMHMGAAKTWYGVPRDARLAFEDVIRVHGYGGEINQLVTFATLGEKTTVMSPEVLIGAGIPCCRLVQNVGEFVVTFPGAYHTGFSHGFNCAEASNIATPEWLRFAKEAAIRRASINYPPMVSHFQLLYALALTLCSRVPLSSSPKPRSSRLKEKRRGEGENVVKDLFVRDVIKNNDLLHILLNQGSCVLVPQNFSRISASLDIRAGSQREVKSRLPLRCHNDESQDAPGDLAYDDNMLERHVKLGHLTGVRSVCGRSMFDRDRLATSSVRHDQRESDKLCNLSSVTVKPDGEKENTSQGANLLQQELFSCVTCGILSYACAAVIQPREATVGCLMSSNGNFFNDWNDGSRDQYLITNGKKYTSDTNYDSKIIDTSCQDGLYDVPVQSGEYQIQVADQNYEAQEADQNYEVQVVELSHEVQVADQNHQVEIVDQTVDIISDSGAQKDVPSLDLLAFAYGSASDSDDEQVTPELPVSKCDIGEQKLPACSDSLLHSLEPDDQDGAAEGNSHSSSKLGHRDEISACYSRQPSCYKRKRKCTSSNLTIKSQQISECSVETDREMGPKESSCLTNLRRDAGVLSGRWTTESAEFYENDVYMEQIPSGPATSIPSNSLHTVSKGSQPPSFGDTAKYDNVNVSIKNANMSFVHRSNEDSLRKHIFCLDHAVEVEKQLRPVGGAHMLLLCRSDYPNVEAEAKLLAEELGINYDWKDILFNEANQEELETIRLALDDEEALPGNGDWAVKLGVNLYYSANLSRSPLYNKQLPYNSIIYKAFGCSSPENSIAKDKLSGKASSKQKKIVLAGKWCGKVWMSNQVHPYLADRATEEENSFGFHTPATSNLRPSSRPERKVETNQPSEQLTPCLEPCSKIEREVEISHHREHVTSSSKPNPESKREAEISHQFDQPPLPDKKSSSSRVTTTITRKRGQKRKRKTVNKATRRSKFVSLGKATKATEAEDSSASDSPSQGVRISKTEQPKKPLCRGSSARKIQSGTINKPQSPSFDNPTEETEEEDSSESDSLSQGGRIRGRQRPKMTLLRSIDSRKKENTITKRPESPSVDNPIDATDSDYSSESDFPSRGGKIIRCEQLKTPLPRGSNLKNSQQCNSDSKDENEGGPSTRLRKRPSKPADVVPPKSSKKSKAAKKEKRAPIFSSNDVKDEELEYQCDVDGCTMGFNTKQELVFHKRNICSVKGCGKKFFSHKYLLQHRRVHIDDRPLKCPWKGCKMSFKWAWARTEHIRVHTGARPYACPVVGCEQTFRFVSDFSRHKRKTGHAAKR